MADSSTIATAQQMPTWYDSLSKNYADVMAGGLENISGLNWYSDPLVQGFDPLQTGAINAAGTAGGAWQPQTTAAGNTLGTAQNQVTAASNFDPNQTAQFINPYLQGAQQSTINASNKNLFENIMPRINSTFAGAGQFGSSRNADFMNRGIDNQQRMLTDAIGNLNYGAQTDAFKNQLGWGQLGTQGSQVMGGLAQLQQALGKGTSEMQWNDLSKQFGFGQAQQDLGQRELDASYTDWQNQLKTPIDLITKLMGPLSQMAQPYAGNKVQVTAPNSAETGTLEQIIAAILAGRGAGAGS